MLNYANLNDVEFEYLCQDIMSKTLSKPLRRFAPGKDGGIDLTDNVESKNIVIQIKHYTKTSVSGLMSSLKKEISKVKALNPKQYYICCSKELSPDKIREIYELFSDYMESDKNIYTLIEIDNFLVNPNNIDILRKHYKLWIVSTGILEDIFTKDIFIDSEMLLCDIHDQVKFFVQTRAYDEALRCLEKNHALFITGDPGVGKTITSKMLILHFATHGYAVRYTTNGADLNQLKRSLSQNRDKKEIVLLDDCFGQAYFNMKETQGTELLSLIKYIHRSPNKLLILNSRVTIYQEAKARTPELITSFEHKEYKVNIIDINQMPRVEKAKIYYNHLYFNQVDNSFWSAIRSEKGYRAIITHRNYNPRIIEFISNPKRFETSGYTDYMQFVMDNLENPKNIWQDEYERKLNFVDRTLLSTLYSLSETVENYEYVERIFNHRIGLIPGVDLTINNFESSLNRLQESFIKIVSVGNEKKLAMANPSINDYLRLKIIPTSPEYISIVQQSRSVKQLKRLLSDSNFNKKIEASVKDVSILSFIFENSKNKNSYITYQVLQTHTHNLAYKGCIFDFLNECDHVCTYEKVSVSLCNVLEMLFSQDNYNFYLINYFTNWEILDNLLSKLEFIELLEIIKICYNYFPKWKIEFHQKILDEMESYCEVEAENYDSDLDEFVNRNKSYWEYGVDVDEDQAALDFEESIKASVSDEIIEALSTLPVELDIVKLRKKVDIQVNGAGSVIESYIQSLAEPDDDDSYHLPADVEDYSDIDYIFDRSFS